MIRLAGLRYFRELRRYSEAEPGRLVNLRAGEIAEIERGERQVQAETAVKFSQVLRVGLHNLIQSPEERASAARDPHLPSRHPNDVVFSCFDPAGRPVIARRGRWEEHVEGEHPEVGGHDTAVAQTIRAPGPDHAGRRACQRGKLLPNGRPAGLSYEVS